MKTCTICKKDKPIDNFGKHPLTKDNHQSNCKECHNNISKKWRKRNKKKYESYNKEWKKNSKEKLKEYLSKYRRTEKYKKYNRKYQKSEKHQKYRKHRRKSDPLFKLKENIRCLIRNTFINRKYRKSSRTVSILGCEILDFKKYMENQFDTFMTWENHGNYWEIDHRIPVSSAKDELDLIKLNHFSNLRPLEKNQNRVKSNKIEAQ